MITIVRASATEGEVELVATAARFFADRLIPVSQQKKIKLNIAVTDMPNRKPIAIKWLVGTSGFFGDTPPGYFEMTISTAAGVKDGLESAANEIAHIAQVTSGRLKICLKKRKTEGLVEQAYAASWLGGKPDFVDITPRSARLWETEAAALRSTLVDEFLSWSSGQIAKLPTQKAKKGRYALYPVREAVIAAPVAMPTMALEPQYSVADPIALADDDVALAGDDLVLAENDVAGLSGPSAEFDFRDAGADAGTDSGAAAQPSTIDMVPPAPSTSSPPATANRLDRDIDEFKIAVDVPRLGMARMLHSGVLHGKLNDLLERGLIRHEAARAALRNAQNRQHHSG